MPLYRYKVGIKKALTLENWSCNKNKSRYKLSFDGIKGKVGKKQKKQHGVYPPFTEGKSN